MFRKKCLKKANSTFFNYYVQTNFKLHSKFRNQNWAVQFEKNDKLATKIAYSQKKNCLFGSKSWIAKKEICLVLNYECNFSEFHILYQNMYCL